MGKLKELKDIFKNFGLRGVKNNLEYEIEKTDKEIEHRKQIIKALREEVKKLRNT